MKPNPRHKYSSRASPSDAEVRVAADLRPIPQATAQRDNLAGIAHMVLGVTTFSAMEAVGKWLAADHSVLQMLAVRSTVAILILLALLPFVGGLSTLRTQQPWGHAVRSLCGVAAFVIYFTALRSLPLADAVTVALGSPLILVALSVPLLGERVRMRQWMAVVLGFIGVLLIVRPSAAGLRPAALLVVLSNVCYALMMILTRRMTRGQWTRETSLSFVFYALGGQALVGWAAAAFAWQPLALRGVALMSAMGVLGLVGHLSVAVALRTAPVAVVAPFEYTSLVWATLFGLVLFGEFPTARVWLGAALVVLAGLYAVTLANTSESSSPS